MASTANQNNKNLSNTAADAAAKTALYLYSNYGSQQRKKLKPTPQPNDAVVKPTNAESAVAPNKATPAFNVSPPSPFQSNPNNLIDLTSGGNARVLFATDEWFATAEHLFLSTPPKFDPDAYCNEGKVMDGWETRRRRLPGHDWCVVQLTGGRGEIWGLEVDTAHFTGNHVPRISVSVADLTDLDQEDGSSVNWMPGAMKRILKGGGVQGTGRLPDEVIAAEEACSKVGTWTEILPQTALNPGYEESRMHYFTLSESQRQTATHFRVNYYPDGGVARLKLWGKPVPKRDNRPPLYSPVSTTERYTVVRHSSTDTPPSKEHYPHPELSSVLLGGKGISCSNRHYGVPSNLIQPNPGKDMGDGWETARHPDRPPILVRDPKTDLIDTPLMDWAVLKLGYIATDGVSRIILDTKHFRGNFPESVLVEGCYHEKALSSSADGNVDNEQLGQEKWFTLIPRSKMGPDSEHVFERSKGQIRNENRKVSHVRVSIYPDGGLSRVRIYGKASEDKSSEQGMGLIRSFL